MSLLAEEPLGGTIRLTFQLSEDGEDEEGFSGAYRMMQDGVMEGVEAILTEATIRFINVGVREFILQGCLPIDTGEGRI